ncbi:MAG: DUF975 family protein [Oscillospiraceae bacterium]|nr:DUF975 family protein [Oscillospiraceae bacterium]
MKSTKTLYQSAWKDLRTHYFLNVMIVFLVGFILRDGYQYATDWNHMLTESEQAVHELRENHMTNAEILKELLSGLNLVSVDFSPLAETTAEKYTMGYFSVIVNEITASGSLGFGILNGLNKILFDGKIAESVTIFTMTVCMAFFWIFIKNLILIGRCRYFLERRAYPKTKPDRLLFVYRTGYTNNTAKVMLLRAVRQTLWNLTIIGGFIKYYEYLMIPYLLAENPNITAKEAFSLSKQIMNGDKKTAFKIDLTLLPFALLDGATFHMSSLFFLNPYRECIFAELYAALRTEKKMTLIENGLLCDDMLIFNSGKEAYPDDECPTPHLEKHRWLATDYEKDYTLETAVLFFFLFSFIGYLFEVCFYLVNEGSFINRGTMTGPWLPIYGTGGLIIIYLLKPLRKKPALLFASAFVICGSLEYFTSWLLEQVAHKRWWDYTGYFMNINGRVCLEGLTVFGLAGVAVTYFIAPVSDNLLKKLSPKKRKILCIILLILFVIDCIWSVMHPNTGNGITEGFY